MTRSLEKDCAAFDHLAKRRLALAALKSLRADYSERRLKRAIDHSPSNCGPAQAEATRSSLLRRKREQNHEDLKQLGGTLR